MNAIEKKTCVRFKLRRNEPDYINISSGKFCSSNLGRTGGAQAMTFNTAKCFRQGIIIHELLHALGLIHMHNRPDRDNYIKILRQNVDPFFLREFEKVDPGAFNYYGTPYDYNSIMHYGSKSASKNGLRTILTRDENFLDAIGQRVALSDGDIQRINNKYKCKASRLVITNANHAEALVAPNNQLKWEEEDYDDEEDVNKAESNEILSA